MKNLLEKLLSTIDPWNFRGRSARYHLEYAYEEPNREAPHELFSFFQSYTKENGFELTKEEQLGAPRDRVILHFRKDNETLKIEYCIDRGCCVSSETIDVPQVFADKS